MTPLTLAVAVAAVAHASYRPRSRDIIAGAADAFTPPALKFLTRRVALSDRCLFSNIVDDDDDDAHDGGEEEEWRSFRARLVRNGLPFLEHTANGGSGGVISDDDASPSVAAMADGDASRAQRRMRRRNNNDELYAHESTPLVEVGSILVSVPTPDLCQALEQQYWHRAVVLITRVSDNSAFGNVEDSVPEDQLAWGAKRGRWGYRGLLLNRGFRCAAAPSLSAENNDDDYDEIRGVHQWGGDLLGIDSSDGTEIVCLHHPDRASDRSEDARTILEGNTKLVGHLSFMTPACAKRLCRDRPTSYRPSDFVTFAGFCSWRPGQLEVEMGEDRNEWKVLSVDGWSIWDELQSQRRKIQSSIANEEEGSSRKRHDLDAPRSSIRAGTEMWANFLGKIGIAESKTTEGLSPGQLDFYDGMLEVWGEDKLNEEVDAQLTKDVPAILLDDNLMEQIGPGTIVRARSPPTNDMLLYDGEFIRSLILVLEDTHDATMGVILNHPMAAAIEFKDGTDPLPIRYGGPIDVISWKYGSYGEEAEEEEEEEEEDDDEDDDEEDGIDFDIGDFMYGADSIGDDHDDNDDEVDDSSFIWIHRNLAFGRNGGGTRLGTSSLWLIKEDDAIESLKAGLLQMEDVMVFSGVSIWEKGPDLGRCSGGLLEQIESLCSFEVVRSCDDQSDDDTIGIAWGILTNRQSVLTQDSLDNNIDSAISAWTQCCTGKDVNSTASRRDNARTRLSDATLKAWLGSNLLGDPLGTAVEMSGQR
jgi:putative AlgH/UPF0301 family transcriptional regulator